MLVILSIFAGLLVVVAGMFLVFFLIESNKHSYTKDALLSQRAKNKSIEVRMGFMVEKMAPFLDIFPTDPNNAHFLGAPIDYISFGDDEIVFIEVKTGASRLSKKQRNIKALVEEGKVRFELVRLKSD